MSRRSVPSSSFVLSVILSVTLSIGPWPLLSSPALAGPLKISTGKLEKSHAWTPLEFEIRGVPDDAEIALKDASGREVP